MRFLVSSLLSAVVLMSVVAFADEVRVTTDSVSGPRLPDVMADTATMPAAAVTTSVILPANTVVEIRTVDAVSSRTNKSGDRFMMRVAAPVMMDGIVVIPVDTPVVGEVIHAARSGFGGKAGELSLAARYIEHPKGNIRLKSSLGSSGRDNAAAAVVTTALIGVVGFVVKGGEKELLADTPLSAKLAVATEIHP